MVFVIVIQVLLIRFNYIWIVTFANLEPETILLTVYSKILYHQQQKLNFFLQNFKKLNWTLAMSVFQ